MRDYGSVSRMTEVVLLTTAEVAERLHVDTSVVRRWVSRGKIKPAVTTPGGHYRFNPSVLAEFIADGEATA